VDHKKKIIRSEKNQKSIQARKFTSVSFKFPAASSLINLDHSRSFKAINLIAFEVIGSRMSIIANLRLHLLLCDLLQWNRLSFSIARAGSKAIQAATLAAGHEAMLKKSIMANPPFDCTIFWPKRGSVKIIARFEGRFSNLLVSKMGRFFLLEKNFILFRHSEIDGAYLSMEKTLPSEADPPESIVEYFDFRR